MSRLFGITVPPFSSNWYWIAIIIVDLLEKEESKRQQKGKVVSSSYDCLSLSLSLATIADISSYNSERAKTRFLPSIPMPFKRTPPVPPSPLPHRNFPLLPSDPLIISSCNYLNSSQPTIGPCDLSPFRSTSLLAIAHWLCFFDFRSETARE